jgi:hypothetical protein
VYGLVGLAADAASFPIDYNRDAIQVWSDTILFMSKEGEMSARDIVPFAVDLKRHVLRGERSPWYRSWPRERYSPATDIPAHPIKIKAYILGVIQTRGPTIEQIHSVLEYSRVWRAAMQQNCRGNLDQAHRENDELMEAVHDVAEDEPQSMCLGFTSSTSWNLPESNMTDEDWQMLTDLSTASAATTQDRSWVWDGSPNPRLVTPPLTLSKHSLVFQMNTTTPASKQPLNIFGIASNGVKVGDVVCWVPEANRDVVVRIKPEIFSPTLEISGISIVAKNLLGEDGRHRVLSARVRAFKKRPSIEIPVDLETLDALTEAAWHPVASE